MAESTMPRLWLLLVPALLLLGAGIIAPLPQTGPFLLAAGSAVLAVAAIMGVFGLRRRQAKRELFRAVARFVEHDKTPTFTTDGEGRVGYRNAAAVERFGDNVETLLGALGDAFAAPAAVLHRLQEQAASRGRAEEEVVTRQGRIRLNTHRMGRDGFLWRLEDLALDGGGRGSDDAALPVLAASRTGTILYRNTAMREVIGDCSNTLDEVFPDLPLRSGEIHEVTGPGGARRWTVVETASAAGRREVYLLPARTLATAPDRQLFDALPVPLLEIAATGEVEMANRLARDLLADQMAVGTPMSSLVEGLGRPVGEWIADALEGRGLNKPEVVRASRPSKEVYLQITLGRIEQEGEPMLVAVLNDATELKTLEAQFVQSQKMQAIGQLAGGVAHDFNNLLTAISGHCDLLLLRHDAGDPDYSDLSQIAQNANRAASLVRQLLAFSRKQNLKPQSLDLRESLSDLAHLLNRLVGEKVTLELSHDPELKMIRADKRQLEQVLMNLVVNARDAMPSGGRIEISTKVLTLREPMRRDRAVVPTGEWVVVRVVDQGVGIPPDKLPKIFEPFFTTKRTGEGTGLGLSTAYGIVKQTGGFIFADSVPGTGTEFSLYFPAHDAPSEPEAEAAKQVSEAPRQGDGVVLLVEDEAPVRAFAGRALRMRGYTVLEAENAEEALKLLEDETLRVDVFVTDVIMPGMDGPSWVREALKARPDTRVVFVSGYAEDSLAEDQARIPNSKFLPKPFSLTDLTSTVHAQFDALAKRGD
ncbi:hybrid sensor histidine kinase/response regulator [Roseitranquillus sediminis]|uniref:hybrid sensor histidine kinase/response regulator n=1 Tax=Roseitranquillus sediminis TaxID=2809051 RepID=UPI001D0C8DF0|nr:ATP-binding protein [Roseitranquillus sediminis]MBM9595703.1 response regulator [Roseitranquillus sediminis]